MPRSPIEFADVSVASIFIVEDFFEGSCELLVYVYHSTRYNIAKYKYCYCAPYLPVICYL
jgi:hypothetical protein